MGFFGNLPIRKIKQEGNKSKTRISQKVYFFFYFEDREVSKSFEDTLVKEFTLVDAKRQFFLIKKMYVIFSGFLCNMYVGQLLRIH